MTNPIFFILPDPLIAVGIQVLANKFDLHLICLDDHPVLKLLKNQGLKTFSLKHQTPKIVIKRTAAQILSQPQVLSYIRQNTAKNLTPQIAVFKPSLQIETLCRQHHFQLLANPYRLNQQFEDKTRFYPLLSTIPELRPHLLPFQVSSLDKLNYSHLSKQSSLPFVLQFGRGWAGNSTLLIDRPRQLSQLQSRWPRRHVKITPHTPGLTLINNACISRHQILISPPAIQIQLPIKYQQRHQTRNSPARRTGGKLETYFSTLGRQWPAPIPRSTVRQIFRLTTLVGQLMIERSYQGFFGLDFLYQSQNHHLFILECNPRLTASFGFYTQLESSHHSPTLLEHHFNSFSDISKPPDDHREDKKYYFTSSLSKQLPKTSNPPVSGSQLAIRNLNSQPLRITHQLPPGTYSFVHNQLKYLRPDLDLPQNQTPNFLLLPPPAGRIIPQNNLLFIVSSLHPLANDHGVIISKTQQLIRMVTRQIS